MTTVSQLPLKNFREPEIDFQAEARRLVEQRELNIRHMLSLLDRAELDLKAAEKAAHEARDRRDKTRRQLSELIGTDERLVIGNVLLTRNRNGGLQIETVRVVGLV